MFDSVDEILKNNKFDSAAVYAISGKALGEIVMRLQELYFEIEDWKTVGKLLMNQLIEDQKEKNPTEFNEIQKTIEDYYNHERYET